ncbi:hypothetical protein [Neisseria dentiae]|uniref:hypothetical protein n=1 Tax=Neisseria dentiae TaxID=194197 RepID=UPI00359FCC51
MNTKNYAHVSDIVYLDLSNRKKIETENGTVVYDIVKVVDNKQTGYYGAILYRQDTNELIVAHRGTLPEKGNYAKDILVDLGMATKNINEQYGDAAALTKEAIHLANTKYNNIPIRQTGHSLGGTLAQLCGNNFGHVTETFNAYGAANLKEARHGSHSGLITNHMRATDAVSAASPHIGKKVMYANKEEIGLLLSGGYGKYNPVPNMPWKTAVSGTVFDHGIGNFTEGITAEDKNRAAEYRGMINEYREEFRKEAEKAAKTVNGIENAVERAKSLLSQAEGPEFYEAQYAAFEQGGHGRAFARHDEAAGEQRGFAVAGAASGLQETNRILDGLDWNKPEEVYAALSKMGSPEESSFMKQVALEFELQEQLETQQRELALQQQREQEAVQRQQRGFSMGMG